MRGQNANRIIPGVRSSRLAASVDVARVSTPTVVLYGTTCGRPSVGA